MNIIRCGLESFYNEAEAELKNCATEEEGVFLRSAMRGLLAVKRIAEKFAEAADRKLKTVSESGGGPFPGNDLLYRPSIYEDMDSFRT